MTAVRVRPEADRDVEIAADYYAQEANLDVALRFLHAVEETFSRLGDHPCTGTLVKAFSPRLTSLRFCPVAGFDSYLVFHTASPEEVQVLRVLHAARDLARFFEDLQDE